MDLWKTADGRMTALLEIPGMSPRGIKLNRQSNGRLIISGRRLSYVQQAAPPVRAATPESEEGVDQLHDEEAPTQVDPPFAQEIRYGPFARALPVPVSIRVSSHSPHLSQTTHLLIHTCHASV